MTVILVQYKRRTWVTSDRGTCKLNEKMQGDVNSVGKRDSTWNLAFPVAWFLSYSSLETNMSTGWSEPSTIFSAFP